MCSAGVGRTARTLVTGLLFGMAFLSSRLAAAACEVTSLAVATAERERVMRAAKDCSTARDYATAEALYRALLARDTRDDEARLGLARLNAWKGSWDEAGAALREILERHPRDVDARALLFDLLLWQRRWVEAQRVVETGLGFSPRASALLMRRARLAHWLGDETEAATTATLAEIEGPLEPELEEMNQRIFLGEARLVTRVDAFPGGYPNQYQLGVQGLHRTHRFQFTGGAQLLERSGGADRTSVLDNRYFAALGYHLGVGAQASFQLAVGAPARFIPRFEAKVAFLGPISRRLTGYFAYAAWLYGGDKTVHIFAPALGFAVSDRLELDLRWWTSLVVLTPSGAIGPVQDAEMVHSAGLHGTLHALPRLDLGLGYTYGVVLDQVPNNYLLLDLRSHLVTAYGDWIADRAFGVRTLVGVERRRTAEQPPIVIFSTELALYTRW